MRRNFVAIVLGITLAGVGTVALASRNSSGTYSLPISPFVSGTTISSANMNAQFADIGSTLTASLDRNGNGGMLADLRGVDGTVTLPAYSFTNETGSGLYRIGAHDIGLSVNGTQQCEWNSTGMLVPGTLGVTGAATLASTLGVTGTINGATIAATTFNGATIASTSFNGATITSTTFNGVVPSPQSYVDAKFPITNGELGAYSVSQNKLSGQLFVTTSGSQSTFRVAGDLSVGGQSVTNLSNGTWKVSDSRITTNSQAVASVVGNQPLPHTYIAMINSYNTGYVTVVVLKDGAADTTNTIDFSVIIWF